MVARTLVVMAKAPRLGAVKTRLGREVGLVAARACYRAITAALLRRVARDKRWRTVLVVTPDRFARRGRFWPRGVPRAPQGPGDLGQRMARAMRAAPPGPVVVVGSDIPELGARHVAAAFRALGTCEMVFGPARDGGYWLVGARRRPLSRGLFRGVRWSSARALGDTLAGLPPGLRVAFLDTLADLDTAADLGVGMVGKDPQPAVTERRAPTRFFRLGLTTISTS